MIFKLKRSKLLPIIHLAALLVVVQAAPAEIATTVPDNNVGNAKIVTRQLKLQQNPPVQNCSSQCSAAEYSTILQRIIANDDGASILRRFREVEESVAASSNAEHQTPKRFGNNRRQSMLSNNIRPACVRELIGLIKGLAANELELKTMLEFASDSGTSKTFQAKQPPTSSYSSLNSDPLDSLSLSKNSQARFSLVSLDVNQMRWLQSGSNQWGANRSCQNSQETSTLRTSTAPDSSNTMLQANNNIVVEGEKSRLLPKLVQSVDHWIQTLERFTVTQEWASLLKVFQGSETILAMFVRATTKPVQQQQISVQSNSSTNSSTMEELKFLEKLKLELPQQVLILTSSLNNLFPWHVWPWNNLDLYNTVDTFLNHGLFAFSKTTLGPHRRIDFLPDMLQTLFKSFKYETFPKKCTEWSKIICDPLTFHDRLVLSPPSDDELKEEADKQHRSDQVAEMAKVSKNQLVQELTCIMFSSLSVKHFGGNGQEEQQHQSRLSMELVSSGKLSWDHQVEKAIKLYTLAREALTNQEWLAIYNLIHDLWSQQKVSDRVIMVGRVIQLLTNCHTPKEMLESALWKDIYKYKNVLNQLLDIVIEELNRSSETGKLAVEQLAMGSKSLEVILTKVIKFLPNLVEALSHTIVEELPELVNRFFTQKASFFRVPCKGYSFADIVPSLAKYREELVEIEELVCQQLQTKPNITMMQINNLTNDFLAMALNLSSFGSSLSIPKLLLESSPAPSVEKTSQSQLTNQNVSSIVDQMAANPRLAQVVAILQSSTLDPPEVHAELPELDWVEAGTSIALLYESIQKLLSYEEVFTIFPELPSFQAEMKRKSSKSQLMFKKFSKQDPIRLVAYSLDAAMPLALRTYKPLESFHADCQSSFRDIFSELGDLEGKVTRQWSCLVSGANFASWAINNFTKTFNSMFRNILTHMTLSNISAEQQRQGLKSLSTRSEMDNSSCLLFDGSIGMMLDNLPQFIDLALETVLMASTTSDQQLSLQDIICSSHYMLDPFNERSVELKARLKSKMCHLFNKNSLINCAQVLNFDQWTSTMRELNTTWFESSAIGLGPSSFREIISNAHESLELFGQFKPSTMADSFIGRLLNVNSFWSNLLAKIMGIMDKYQEKRFEYALQTLTPIIYDNLPGNNETMHEIRETLVTTILGAKAILNYLDKQSSSSLNATLNSTTFEGQIQTLFNWADQYALVSAEVLLRTMANNMTKLERIFDSPRNSSGRLAWEQVWNRFCSSDLDTYLDVARYEILASDVESTTTTTLSPIERNQTVVSQLFLKMDDGRKEICKFEWQAFYQRLGAGNSNKMLADYPERQLTRIMLTKWGQVLDVMLIESKNTKQLPKFFYMDYWQVFREKLPQITPLKEQPSNLVWIWIGFERLVNAMDAGTNQTSTTLLRILDQLNCGLDAVKGGLSWENIANIYSDKQDILAAHSTINNGFALASIGVNTFFTQKKFQRFLDELVKPRVGLNAFCELRDRNQLESVFSIPQGEDFNTALESFQELICDTNFETLAQNINPISVCYQTSLTNASSTPLIEHPLADIMDRFFKLASLAILDAKLVAASEAKPPILDKNQWSNFWSWWSDKADKPQPKNSVALTVVRVFQTIDSVNSDHVVWKALFRVVHELSDIVAYLLRAVEKKHQEVDMIGAASRLSLVREAASQIDIAIKSNGHSKQSQQQQLASTLSNIMFPEVNNFISFRTFKQLRYIKTISEYFVQTPGAQKHVCRRLDDEQQNNRHKQTRIELIGYKLNTNEKLYSLLCHYHSSQWLTALNIVISTRTSSIPKKINYMTKYLSIFTRQHNNIIHTLNHNDDNQQHQLESFIHNQQLENIESVANTTVTYLLATSQSLKSLSFSKISNISWHSLPNLLDDLDRHLCAHKHEQGSFHLPKYEPKKPELETVLCKLPHWNMTQVYNYLSENFDLQNMISLISTHNTTAGSHSLNNNNGTTTTTTVAETTTKVCVTPFKFASRWLRIGQELVDDVMSKTSRDKIRKCLSSTRKGQSVYSQTLRYLKTVNSLLASINDLSSDSWMAVKKTWSSISYLILKSGN